MSLFGSSYIKEAALAVFRNLLAQLKLLDVAEPSDDDKFDLLSTELNVSIREG